MKCSPAPNGWSCLANAFAMALDIPIHEIFKSVGHDGSEIIWKDLPEPFNRRSFHIQEMVAMCRRRFGLYVTEYQAVYALAPTGYNVDPLVRPNLGVMEQMLSLEIHDGVLTGFSGKMPHAVAWDGYEKMIYDAGGCCYSIDKFSIQSFWCFSR